MLGYDVDPGGGRLVVNEAEAERVRAIFALFEQYGSVLQTLEEIERLGSPHAARRLMAVDGGSQPKARPWAESLRKLTPSGVGAAYRATQHGERTSGEGRFPRVLAILRGPGSSAVNQTAEKTRSEETWLLG